ncbi:uncharacterized protein METZ01_LOCUS307827 [marine metagenome]|uniref:Uncharacterized protein n=1 Tax=marine metagenome TaxID=408172 RepID=A0A382N176_9ZZZZ
MPCLQALYKVNVVLGQVTGPDTRHRIKTDLHATFRDPAWAYHIDPVTTFQVDRGSFCEGFDCSTNHAHSSRCRSRLL